MIGYLTSQQQQLHAARRVPAVAAKARAGDADVTARIFVPGRRLGEFLREADIADHRGSLDRVITGVVADSRRVEPGNLFFALPGASADIGNSIAEAIDRGAAAIVCTRLPIVPQARVTFVRVADLHAVQAAVARRFFGEPDRAVDLVAVTGASGKTSAAHLVHRLLGWQGRVGLIGDIAFDLGRRTVPAFRGPPEAVDVFGMLAQMRAAGCREAVVEVGTAALARRNLRDARLRVAIFTGSGAEANPVTAAQSEGAAAMRRLFTGEIAAIPHTSVVNLDDGAGVQLAEHLVRHVAETRLVTFGEHPNALVRAEGIHLSERGATFRLVWPDGALEVVSPLLGRAHVSNLLAAVAAAWSLGRDPAAVVAGLARFGGVRGRLERIEAGQDFEVVIDSASDPAALRRAVAALRVVTAGRVIVVFGCAGEGDRALRPALTAAAQANADFVFATADNPRREAVERIFADMRAGITAPGRIAWVEDRRRALAFALGFARAGDAVLVAGKGHESFQELSGRVVPFDDRQVARELLARSAPSPQT
jgi:UDP-N-acetylmuramoyl-L-alanyl-D-glutamate--2,6-diaminopimelate ligase